MTPTIKLTKKSKTVKAKAAKKKAQTFRIGVKTNSAGKISFKVTKKDKHITFKKGKVTLKKGTKRGKYSINVKVSVAKKGAYTANAKSFKISFIVK